MKPVFTKIVATLGPSSGDAKTIGSLMKAGVDVFRINFSHGTHAEHQARFQTIRKLAQKQGRHFSILADLQGPKLRVGHFQSGSVVLKVGQSFCLDMNPAVGDNKRVNLPHPEIYKVAKNGMSLLLNDGQIRLKITKVDKDSIQTKVLVGGVLSDHKGVNLPDVLLPISALTDKDKKDLNFALKLGVDWIGLSFVQQPDDVRLARRLIGEMAGIIVKVEKPSAMTHLEEIVSLADGIMVARGDLGVECPIETVPAMQRKIVDTCRRFGKPVIVATQMLESMIQTPVPTRAEVSDVATAVYEGADCVMLSAETAAGKYPVQAVATMRKIIDTIQADTYYAHAMEAQSLPPDKTVASAITAGMKNILRVLDNPACIATYSISGKTTLRAARERVPVPILGLTPDNKIADKLALVWGVVPVKTRQLKDMIGVSPIAVEIAKDLKLAQKGQEIIITAGIPFAKTGKTNILHITVVE